MTYSKLPPEAFRKVGIHSGVLLTAFDPKDGAAREEDILGATEGPVRFSAKPVLVDLGSGIQSCPNNALEYCLLTGWDVRLSGAFVTADLRSSGRLIGPSAQAGSRLIPRAAMDFSRDFNDLWLVFDYGDLTAPRPGGYAILVRNALSTGGLRLRLEPGKHARWLFEFTAFCSAEAEEAAFEVYVGESV